MSPDRRPVLRRRLLATVNAVAQGVLLVWIVLQLNVLGYQRSWRHDLTRDKIYEVTPEMRSVLAQLPRDRHVDVIIPFGVAPTIEGQLQYELFARALRVCQEFQAVNPSFRVHGMIDVMTRGMAWMEAKEKYGIDQPNRVHLLYGDLRVALTVEELAKFRQGPQMEIEREYVAEAISAALQRLLLEERPVVCLTQGNGEIPVNRTGASGMSVQVLVNALAERGYQVRLVDLTTSAELPEDTELVIVIPGAREFRRFEGHQRRVLENHLEGGGSLLLFAPFLGRTGLEHRLERMGIDLHAGWVAVESRGQARVDVLATDFDKKHPITANFDTDTRFELRLFHPVEAMPNTPAVSLVRSPRAAWLELSTEELQRDTNDERGPFTLVAAAEGQRDGARGRAVVFGFMGSVLDRPFTEQHDTRQLILNSVYWLTGRQELAAGVGRKVRADRISTEDQFLSALFWVTVVVTPLLALISGIVVALVRRR